MLVQPPKLFQEMRTTSQIMTQCGLKYSAGKKDMQEATLTTISNADHIHIKYRLLLVYQGSHDLLVLKKIRQILASKNKTFMTGSCCTSPQLFDHLFEVLVCFTVNIYTKQSDISILCTVAPLKRENPTCLHIQPSMSKTSLNLHFCFFKRTVYQFYYFLFQLFKKAWEGKQYRHISSINFFFFFLSTATVDSFRRI